VVTLVVSFHECLGPLEAEAGIVCSDRGLVTLADEKAQVGRVHAPEDVGPHALGERIADTVRLVGRACPFVGRGAALLEAGAARISLASVALALKE